MSDYDTLAMTSASGVTPARLDSHWRRLAQIGIGHSLYAAFCWLFDHVLYVYVVYTLGILLGGAIMTAASLLICIATLMIYERMKVDWVGAGLLNEIAARQRHSLTDRLLVWTTRQNRVVVFLILCALSDPFITTAYLRGGAFNGLRKRDWQIFCASVLVSNLYWIFAADLIGHAVVTIWTWFTTTAW